MIPPWIGNVLYVFELGPVPGQDWTSIGFALTGAGLGLAIVKEIAELHGRWVTVESPSTGSGQAPSTALRAGEECVGSTFTVWLPLAD